MRRPWYFAVRSVARRWKAAVRMTSTVEKADVAESFSSGAGVRSAATPSMLCCEGAKIGGSGEHPFAILSASLTVDSWGGLSSSFSSSRRHSSN